MLYAGGLGTGGWLCFSSILAVAQSEPRERCPDREEGEQRNGTEMGNKKKDRDRPRPGSGFWNWEGNEMVQCYQFNWKLESSILLLMKGRVRKRMKVMGRGEERKDRAVCKGHAAQFTSVKETIWLQFLLLSHSLLLNSLFVQCWTCACLCAHMYVYACACVYVCTPTHAYVCMCVGLRVCVWACMAFLAACAPDAQGCCCVATH